MARNSAGTKWMPARRPRRRAGAAGCRRLPEELAVAVTEVVAGLAPVDAEDVAVADHEATADQRMAHAPVGPEHQGGDRVVDVLQVVARPDRQVGPGARLEAA